MSGKSLDLDALKLARAEKRGDEEPPFVMLGGKKRVLPPVLPAEFLLALGAIQGEDMSRLEPMLQQVFGPEYDEIISLMDTDDLAIVVQKLPSLYEREEGESKDSSPS